MPRLTAEIWMTIRAEREAVGASLRVLAKRHGVDHAAIVRRAKREGWKCGTARALLESRTRELVTAKVTAVDAEMTAAVIESEATARATVELRHRDEWQYVRAALMLAVEASKVAETLEAKRAATRDLFAVKVSAQALATVQAMERQAYRLDDEIKPAAHVQVEVGW